MYRIKNSARDCLKDASAYHIIVCCPKYIQILSTSGTVIEVYFQLNKFFIPFFWAVKSRKQKIGIRENNLSFQSLFAYLLFKPPTESFTGKTKYFHEIWASAPWPHKQPLNPCKKFKWDVPVCLKSFLGHVCHDVGRLFMPWHKFAGLFFFVIIFHTNIAFILITQYKLLTFAQFKTE